MLSSRPGGIICQKGGYVARAASPQITELLLAWSNGDQSALARIVELAYPELYRIARRCLHRERSGHTIQATALVNEAYLRLVDIHRMRWQDRAHFFAVGAKVMRRVLVDYARAQGRAKRQRNEQRVDLTESLMVSNGAGRDVIQLNDALQALEKFDGRKAQVVEMKYFGGLKANEIAEVLGVSIQTVHLDWSLAKAWLLRQMDRGEQDGCTKMGSN
jgi:RNA polymerase sigma factor (TIGR02999 family)